MLKHFRSGSKRIRTIWWVLTIGTVGTFIGGFIFLFGAGVGDDRDRGASGDVVGKVEGRPITAAEWDAALRQVTQQYKNQMGQEPIGTQAAMVEEQAWSNLV